MLCLLSEFQLELAHMFLCKKKYSSKLYVMSAAQKRLLDQDPDYESVPVHAERKRFRLHEQDAKEATLRTIEQIIKTQFSQEISTREVELDAINQRIYDAQALLDRLRANVVAKYYATGGGWLPNGQGHGDCPPSARVHPTIRRYLGKAVPGEYMQHQEEEPGGLEGTLLDKMLSLSSKRMKTSEMQVMSIGHTGQGPRFKNKIRVMVGNVSKYIPSEKRDPNDHSTHKWMVYVRCHPGGPHTTEVVRKVRYFLHPSYRPNDLVEISEPPFHLVRKGWGEFPLRAQLHFVDERNKPIDIIHNLKLDKTCTGLQTLGAETVVDLWTCCTGGNNVEALSGESSLQWLGLSTAAGHKNHKEEETRDANNQNSELQSEKAEAYSLSNRINGDVFSTTKTGNKATSVSSLPLQSTLHLSVPLPENQLLTVTCQSVLANSQSIIFKQSEHNMVLVEAETPAQSEKMKTVIVETCCAEQRSPTESAHRSLVAASWRSTSTATTATAELGTIHPKPQLSVSAVRSSKRCPLPSGESLLILNNPLKNMPKEIPVSGVQAQPFLKCKDMRGRMLLIPSTSLLMTVPQLKPPESSSTGLVTSTYPGVSLILKNNVMRPILPKNTVCLTTEVPPSPTAAPVLTPAVSTLSVCTSGHVSCVPARTYTLLVVPRGDKANSQILLVPRNALRNTAGEVGHLPLAVVEPASEAEDRERNGGETNVPQTQGCGQQIMLHKKDPLDVLRKKIDSIRLSDYKDYSDALLRVAYLFPLTGVNQEEKQACFPYASRTAASYLSWPLPKRRSSEWLRALAIKKVMSARIDSENPFWASSALSWTTKKVMLWCRKFGFTPLHQDADTTIHKAMISECGLTSETYCDAKNLLADLEKKISGNQSQDQTEKELVDVEGVDVPSTMKKSLSSCCPVESSTLPRIQLPRSLCAQFVKETASEVGVYTSLDEVEPLVDAPIVEEMILAACKRLASTVLRHSLKIAYERTEKNMDPDMVKVEDVYKSVLNLNICDFLTNSNLGADIVHDCINDSTHL